MPFSIGSTTPIIAFVAIAASTAFPPRSNIRTPACAASGDSAATIPPREITIDRPCERSCALAPIVVIVIAASTYSKSARLRKLSMLTRISLAKLMVFLLHHTNPSCASCGQDFVWYQLYLWSERHSTANYSAAMPGRLAKHLANIAQANETMAPFDAAHESA